jgi:hypothetical protein
LSVTQPAPEKPAKEKPAKDQMDRRH